MCLQCGRGQAYVASTPSAQHILVQSDRAVWGKHSSPSTPRASILCFNPTVQCEALASTRRLDPSGLYTSLRTRPCTGSVGQAFVTSNPQVSTLTFASKAVVAAESQITLGLRKQFGQE